VGSRRLLTESGKYAAVSIVATLVAFVLFNWLVHGWGTMNQAPLASHALTAYVLANSFSMIISYRGTRSWAFKNRKTKHPDGGRTAFVLINFAAMVFPVACLWFTRHVLGLEDPLSDNIAANVVGLFFGFLARFWLFRKFVFSESDQHRLTPLLERERS
jgi:putative flippase GtrA